MLKLTILVLFCLFLAAFLFAMLRSVWLLWRGNEGLVPGGSYGRQFTGRLRRRRRP